MQVKRIAECSKREHSAILLTCIKLTSVFKNFVFPIFEWPLKTGLAVILFLYYSLSFGGLVLRHYIEHNVSKSTATTIKYFMKMLANISETVIFMFLGLSTVVDTLDWNWRFILFALLFCIVYRVVGKRNFIPFMSLFSPSE